MPKSFKRLLSIVLRTLVCVGAMYLVLKDVSWNDRAGLADGRIVQFTNWDKIKDDARLDDPLVIGGIRLELAAAPFETSMADLARKKDGSPDFQIGLRTVWTNCNGKLLLLAILIFAPVGLIQSVRFTWMVRAQDINLSYWEGIKLSYAGNFLNFLAIGSTGGDIFKAYYVAQHSDRKTEAITTVLLDRAVGLISLLLIAALAMGIKFNDPNMRRYWPPIALLCLGLFLGISVVFSRRVRAKLRVDQLLERLPFSEHLKRIDAATRRMRQHKKLLAAALLTTLLLQGIAVTGMMVAGFGLGMKNELNLYAGYYAYIAMALLVAAVPITYQGGGTMDGALQIFFHGVYGNYSQILFLGLAMRLLQLIWSLPGFLVPITGAHRPSSEKIAQLQALAAASKS